MFGSFWPRAAGQMDFSISNKFLRFSNLIILPTTKERKINERPLQWITLSKGHMFSLVVIFPPLHMFSFDSERLSLDSSSLQSVIQTEVLTLLLQEEMHRDIWSRQSEFNAVQGPVAPALHPLSLLETFWFAAWILKGLGYGKESFSFI